MELIMSKHLSWKYQQQFNKETQCSAVIAQSNISQFSYSTVLTEAEYRSEFKLTKAPPPFLPHPTLLCGCERTLTTS